LLFHPVPDVRARFGEQARRIENIDDDARVEPEALSRDDRFAGGDETRRGHAVVERLHRVARAER
jgi:hypothetical protein